MMTPYGWNLRLFAQHGDTLTTALPELLALQSFVEHSDWHNDSPFVQSVRLHDWIVTLPDSLFLTITLPPKTLADTLTQPGMPVPAQHTTQELLAFVALIHDVGKTVTFQTHPDGSTSCPGHEEISGRMSPLICGRFTFSFSEAYFITTLVAQHGQPYALCKALMDLSSAEQQVQQQQFMMVHGVYLRPLFLLAYGDFITSHMATRNSGKYQAVLAFYHQWLHELWPG